MWSQSVSDPTVHCKAYPALHKVVKYTQTMCNTMSIHAQKNERSTNDLQNSNGVPQMVVQEDIPSETACTNTTHSNRKNSQPSERNFPLRLSPSLTHYSHMLF